MSNIIKSLEQLKKDYDKELAALKDGLRKEVVGSLTGAKKVLESIPDDDLRREILNHSEVKTLVRGMGGKVRNGTGAKGGRSKVSDADIIAFCASPQKNVDINNHFGVKNLSNRLTSLKKEGKLKKNDDGWVKA